MRGVGGNRVLVLVDGIPQNDNYNVDEVTQDKDDFWTIDASLSRCFFNRLTTYLNVENIFDSVDNESLAPGPIYTGGVKFEF